MNHLAQETFWICLAILAGALGYWRGRRSASDANCHDGSLERRVTQMSNEFGSLADENRRICQEIESLHHRISWIRGPEGHAVGTTLATEEAAQ
jgi:hypothetical protein